MTEKFYDEEDFHDKFSYKVYLRELFNLLIEARQELGDCKFIGFYHEYKNEFVIELCERIDKLTGKKEN